MTNEKVAEEIFEEHGEVGFWYFYKDSVKSHSETLKKNITDGPKAIYQGLILSILGIFMTISWIIGPWIFLITKIPKARKASKHYKEWLETKK